MGTDTNRILLVIRYPVGGIRTYIKYIYSNSMFDDFSFTVISPDKELESFFESVFSGRNFEYLACNDSRDIFIQTWRYMKMNNVSLVHSHGFTAGALTTPISLIYKIPHLMTAHDVFQKKQFSGIKGFLKKSALSALFSRITKIHTVSHDATDDLQTFFPAINNNRIQCIPHGIDSERFFHSTRQHLNLDIDVEKACLIGFFGRFMAQKGFRYLVDAIDIIVNDKLADKTPLVLTFDWGGYVREEYKNIEDRGLKDYFHMMQYTEDMPGMIKAMDMVAMPSLWESSGLLGMEALVSGVPIVAASCIGLREVLGDSPAIMVPPRDAMALANAIAKEINTPSGKTFRDFANTARERFSLQRPSSELKKLYLELLQ